MKLIVDCFGKMQIDFSVGDNNTIFNMGQVLQGRKTKNKVGKRFPGSDESVF